MKSRIATYSAWLVFTGALLVAPRIIAVNNLVDQYHFAWLDVFATAALLFGPLLLITSLVGATMLAFLATRVERSRSERVRLLPSFVLLATFLAGWLHLLRGTLTINEFEFSWLERSFEIPVAVVTAGLLFMVIPAAVGRWVADTAARVRLVSATLTIALVGLLGYVLVEPLDRGSTGPVQVPEASRPRPNVIIIVLDGLTSLDMSLYGYTLPTTPRLDEITKSWTVFENAHSASTATTAVIPTIFTGRYPFTDVWRRYGDLARAGKGLLNLPRILQASGYETIYAMGGGWPLSRYHLHTGFDRIIGGGYPTFFREDYLVHSFPGHDLMNRTIWEPTIADAFLPDKPNPRFNATAFDEPMYGIVADLFQEQAGPEDNTPFFVYMHAMRPHPPYLANEFLGTFLPVEEGMADMRSQNPLIHRRYDPNQPDKQRAMDKLRLRYNESILKADQQLGELVDALKRLELYDESMIIITSDHGTSFTGGVQGYFSSDVRSAEHRIPLLVKFPGQAQGRRVDSAVSLVDILPTVLDVVGATYPATWIDGRSLLAAEQAPERVVYVTRLFNVATLDYDRVAAIQGNLKLVRRKDRELLFNIEDDPDERRNLLGREQARGLQRALKQFARRATLLQDGYDITQITVPSVTGKPFGTEVGRQKIVPE